MLFKSLFCFQGADQGARFALISVSAYLGFVLSISLFYYRAPLLLLVMLAAFATMLTASTMRRINDAELPKAYSAIPVITYSLIVAAILFIDSAASYFLTLLGGVVTAGFALPGSKKPSHYVLGYHGPNAAAVKSMPIASRIEPTFVDGQGEAAGAAPAQVELTADEAELEPTPDVLDPLRHWYQKNQKLAHGIAGGVSLLAVLLTLIPSIDFTQAQPQTAEKPAEPVKPVKVRDFALEMPNDYYLMLDQHDGLIIHWQTSDNDNPALWSILTGKGDQSCKELVFNDKKRIRTNLVSVENGGDYYVELSPLDTKTAVTAIADKSSFSLCGYDFSLKGSRATIDGSETYYVFLQ